MKLEKLKESHLKRNLLIGIVIIGILVTIVLTFTKARYRVAESIPLVNGTINYDLADLNAVAVYIEEGDDYSKSDTIPSNGYTFNEEKSYCTVNGEEDESINVSYDASTQSLSVSPLTTQGTKCYLYFDAVKTLNNAILANNEVNSGTPNFSQTATTDEGVYKTEDNLGTSYYFRGAVTNNYVSFAGFYWRIIRVNGDESIRIIYDGTNIHVNGEASEDRHIGTSNYNNLRNQSYYVGYTFEENFQRPNSQNSGTASSIKKTLDDWYLINIVTQGLDNKVDSNSGFCNDREMASGYSWVASERELNYAAYERLEMNKTPSLICNHINDLYTTKIGLITADEVTIAGAPVGSINDKYFLYTGNYYWTITPFNYILGSDWGIRMFNVGSGGGLSNAWGYNINYVRPVINLKANVTISSGNGTSETPYVVS